MIDHICWAFPGQDQTTFGNRFVGLLKVFSGRRNAKAILRFNRLASSVDLKSRVNSRVLRPTSSRPDARVG